MTVMPTHRYPGISCIRHLSFRLALPASYIFAAQRMQVTPRHRLIDCFLQGAQVFLAGDLDTSELVEMSAPILGVQQSELAMTQPAYKMYQADFAGIGAAGPGAAEHGLAKVRSADLYAIKSPYQLIVAPCFNAVGTSYFIEFAVGLDEAVVDPVAAAGVSARSNDLLKCAVAANLEIAPLHNPLQ